MNQPITAVLENEHRFKHQIRGLEAAAEDFVRESERIKLDMVIQNSSKLESHTNKIQCMLLAWEFGIEKFDGIMDLQFLSQLAQYVNPRLRYPYIGTSMKDDTKKTHEELGEFFLRVNSFPSNIQKGLYSHFHLHRIHPILDGNKRLARTVQNLYLHKEGFMPVYVEVDEWTKYVSLLPTAEEAVLPLDHNRLLDKEKKFYEFICKKLE